MAASHAPPMDEWLRACLDGNLRMPQTYEGGALFLAHAVLARPGCVPLESTDCLTRRQLTLLRRAMERAHRLRRIPVGGRHFLAQARREANHDPSRAIVIDDRRLLYLWNRYRLRAIEMIAQLQSSTDATGLAACLVSGFDTPECVDLLRCYRGEYDRRRVGSEEHAAVLRTAIFRHLEAHAATHAQPDWLQAGTVLAHLFRP